MRWSGVVGMLGMAVVECALVCVVVVSIAACYHPPEPGRHFD